MDDGAPVQATGIAIVGPTASGKTALAIRVAQRISGEIISMDSRQVFRGMDIGTAKPARAERAAVPHFGLDLLAPDERYNAGRFSVDARIWIDEIRRRGNVPILTGGTGFFLRALTHPLFPEPQLERSRKEALKLYLERFSRAELLRWLSSLDEVTARRLEHEGGRHRVARAIEVALLTGKTLSEWHSRHAPAEAPLHFLTIMLDVPREQLYERINRRTDAMIEAGLVDEVRNLLAGGYDESTPGMNATGYKELLPVIRGEARLEDAVDEIRRATRRYGRRQLTWFRHQLPANTIVLDATQPPSELTEEVASAWLSLTSTPFMQTAESE